MSESKAFSEWCILELMGHRKLGGLVSEQTLAGGAFVRIDVPDPDKPGAFTATQLYSPQAVYCITPTTRELATSFAKGCQPQPVSKWDLPDRKPLAPASIDDDDDRHDTHGDDEDDVPY